MEWLHGCPCLVKNILLEISIWRILHFVAALQRKYEKTKFDYSFDCQRSFIVCVRHFSVTIFESLILFCLKIFCLCLNSPDDPFVEEIYSSNPKLHDVMSWNTKKRIWLIYVDVKHSVSETGNESWHHKIMLSK